MAPMAPWIFQRNKNAQRNSPTTYDVCWRCRPSNRRDAVASAEDNGAAPGAEGASGSAAPTPSSFPDADRELRELCVPGSEAFAVEVDATSANGNAHIDAVQVLPAK